MRFLKFYCNHFRHLVSPLIRYTGRSITIRPPLFLLRRSSISEVAKHNWHLFHVLHMTYSDLTVFSIRMVRQTLAHHDIIGRTLPHSALNV